MKKYIWSIGGIVVIGIVVFTIWTVNRVNKFETFMAELTIGEIELSAIEDGIYTGIADGDVISVEVEVEVKEHQVKSIELVKHVNGQGDGASVITEDIIEAQSIQIDNVSGATLSSKVIRKAVENAFNGKEEK